MRRRILPPCDGSVWWNDSSLCHLAGISSLVEGNRVVTCQEEHLYYGGMEGEM